MEEQQTKEVSDCPACKAKRLHTKEDWEFHSFRGHGYNPQTRNGPLKGWTHPGLLAEWEEKQAKKNG